MRITFLLLLVAYHFSIFAQWNNVASPVAGTIYDMKFINDSTGFCIGSSGIIKTSDYGNTWHLTNSSPSGYSSIFFVNETIGYVTQGNDLYKSIDSGNTWQQIYNFSNETPEEVFFTSTNNGYLISSIYGPPGGSFIYKTTNGGANWTKTDSFPTIPTLQSITFTNSDTGFVVGYSGQIIKTYNAGINWTSTQISNTGTLISLSFPSETTGFAVGYSNNLGSEVIKTTDAGNSWQNISTGGSNNQALRGVYFPSVDTGYAVGENGRIIFTIDSGNTWTISNSGTSYDLFSTFFISNNIGFTAGTGGIILKTNNILTSVLSSPIKNEIMLYPNPTTNYLTIDTELKISDIYIIDITGKMIMKTKQNSNIVNVANLPNGVFFIKIITDEKIITQKFIKQ